MQQAHAVSSAILSLGYAIKERREYDLVARLDWGVGRPSALPSAREDLNKSTDRAANSLRR